MIRRQHIPNLLTLARVLAVPGALAIMLLAPEHKSALLWIFIFASLTDFLDGYLARKWQAVSAFGAMLDPVADKLLVALMLLYLLVSKDVTGAAKAADLPLFLPIAIILLRELYISGLREFLGTSSRTLPVSRTGKWKTALQMLGTVLLLWYNAYMLTPPPIFCGAPFAAAFSGLCSAGAAPMADLAGLGAFLLYLAALLSLISAYAYSRAAFRR